MPPIRRVVFVDDQGKPIRPAPSRLTPLEDEVQRTTKQDELMEFDESRAPAPAAASVHHTSLPAQVGAAQELRRVRRSNAIRDPPRRRLRRRAAKRRMAKRPKAGSRPAARRTTTVTRRTTTSKGGRTRTTTVRRTTRTTRTRSRRVR